MLTDQQREAQRAMLASGLVSADRLRALKHGLLARRDDARAASKAEGLDERYAASLRGKAHAYQEAADMVQQLLYGAPMRPAPWSTARKKARAYHDRRKARIAARQVGDVGAGFASDECTPRECGRPLGDCCLDPRARATDGVG